MEFFNKKWIIALIIIVIIAILACAAYFVTDDSNLEVVRVGYMPSDHSAALFVADAQKQYEKNGIKVELYQFNNGGDIMTAMASGDIDVGYVGITPVLASINKHVPVKIVSSVQTEGSSLIVGKDSNIHSVADLKGKTVATPGAASIQYLLLGYTLYKNNLTFDDLEVVAMKVPFMSNSLRAGQIDAIMTYEPYGVIATSLGYGVELENSSEIIPDHPCCVMVAREDFINNHPDTLEKMIKIHENATVFINTHTDEVPPLLPADIVASQDIEKVSLTKTKFIFGLDEDYKNNVMDFMNLEVEIGMLEKALTKEQIFYK